MALAQVALAQPVNNNYGNAINVTSYINSCSPNAAYTTTGGTADLNAGANWNNSGPKYNVWFKFTAPATGVINVVVDIGGAKGTQTRTQLAIWQVGGTTEIGSKRYVANGDDVSLGAVGLTPGNLYYISVDAYSTSYRGTFTLCLQDQVDYDFYEGATDVTSYINSCSSNAAYTTVGATADKVAGSNWNNSGPNYNRWFKFTAPASGRINIIVDIGGTKGTQTSSQIALWQADGTTEVTSKSYAFTAQDVTIGALGLTPGSTYYISVDTYGSSTVGTFTLCLQDQVDYDFYQGAIDVTSLINGCSANAAYDTRGGTPDKNAGSNWSVVTPQFNRWFKFTAPHADQLRIIVDVGGSKGTQTNSQVALWKSDGTTEIWSASAASPTSDVILRVPGLTPDSVYYISVDSYNTAASGTFSLCLKAVDRNAALVINEVLYAESGAATAAANDEFIEIYNADDSPLDLASMRLLDGNILTNSTDGANSITGSATPFNFVCSGAQVCSGPTVLQPGTFAVVWIGAQTAVKNAAHASYQAWLGQAPKLNNTGDDVWLYTSDSILIDHMAYGTGGEVNLPTVPALWDDTYQASLAGAASGRSISLTPSGADHDASGCWEATTSNDANGRCFGSLPTVDLYAGIPVASPGVDNNAVDFDGDGVPDNLDLDSDDDGIPDKTECPGLVFKGDFEYLTGLNMDNNIGVSILPWILGSGQQANVVQVDGSGGYEYGQHGPFEDADPLTGSGVLQHYLDIASGSNSFYQPFTIATATTITYSGAFSTRENTSGNGSISIRNGNGLTGTLVDGTGLQLVNAFGNSEYTPWQHYSRTITLPAGTYSYVVYMDDYLNFDEAKVQGPCVDTDGDGVPDYQDLDSDNDGIYDLVEAGHGKADADHDGKIDGALTGSGFNGLFDGVETSPDSNVLNYTIKDSDADGHIDAVELDSDNDGCNDVIEAGFIDSNGDGIPGHAPVIVDGNGVVTSLTP